MMATVLDWGEIPDDPEAAFEEAVCMGVIPRGAVLFALQNCDHIMPEQVAVAVYELGCGFDADQAPPPITYRQAVPLLWELGGLSSR